MDITQRWHFIGIGGAGMSALAAALLDLGATVSGSDMVDSSALSSLRERGARIVISHDAANLGDATRVVVTGALTPDNPELLEAQRRGIPVTKRAALLGLLMDMRRGVGVAGTHGKTTTSAMISWVLSKAGRDPSYMVGGTIRGLGPGGHWGGGSVLVAEADEYDSSFLQLRPEVALVTNLEADHLDYYGSLEAIFAAFAQFALNIRRGGLLLVCADDPGASNLAQQLTEGMIGFRIQLYGSNPEAVWRVRGEAANARGGSDYVALYNGREVAHVSLSVPGHHNVLNSLGALAACVELGMDPQGAANLLGGYLGAGRRFEEKGRACGITVVDDYAHHPSEIAATLEAARKRYAGRRIVLLFQPHTYTRTRDFMQGFIDTLGQADHVVVSEIYASREHDTLGLSSKAIVGKITSTKAEYARDLGEASEMLLDDLRAGDVLLTMGAGDVWKAGERVLAALEARNCDEQEIRHIPQARQPDKQLEGSPQGGAPRSSVTFNLSVADDLQKATGLTPLRDEPMSKHNSLRIGGPATLFVTANSVDELVAALLFARKRGLPYIVIGNGTNMLAGDYGINGLVIHNRSRNISHDLLDDGRSLWHVDGGVLFSRLARLTCEAGWTGQEWSNSVPGSVGGGVVSNAGAHGKDIKDDLHSVDILTAGGTVENLPVEALALGYRTSRFKAHGVRGMSPPEVVLRAHIYLYPDTEGKCESTMRGYLEERQAKQPQGKSAGSTFKNPPGNSAGYLIEQVGMKGHRIGQAQFSPKHANFMMNLGGATAAHVRELMEMARTKVRAQFGIELEPEIEFIGE